MIRKVSTRAERIYREIEKAGCLTSAAIAERVQATHSELFYVLRMLRHEGRVEAVNLGRISLWCASRAAAEEVLAKLSEALKGTLCRRGGFATPKEALQLVAEDKEMRKLFSRYMSLRPNPVAIQIIDALMEKTFGKPIKTSRSNIYYVRCMTAEKPLRDGCSIATS